MDKQWEHKIGRCDVCLLERSPKSRRFPIAARALRHDLKMKMVVVKFRCLVAAISPLHHLWSIRNIV
jgi:hypothetical protein